MIYDTQFSVLERYFLILEVFIFLAYVANFVYVLKDVVPMQGICKTDNHKIQYFGDK